MTAAWRYWGIDCAPDKPEATALNDNDLYELTIKTEKLPSQALSEIWMEWDRRHLRVKVYRDTSPRKKR